eukprot:scaffold42500_cov30-Tisochrysis_lutea.AAC.1
MSLSWCCRDTFAKLTLEDCELLLRAFYAPRASVRGFRTLLTILRFGFFSDVRCVPPPTAGG